MKKIMPYDISLCYNLFYLEKWLEEQSSKGFDVVSILSRNRAQFKNGDLCIKKYFIIPKSRLNQVNIDNQWQMLDDKEYCLFVSSSEHAEKPDFDELTIKQDLKKNIKNSIIAMISVVLLWGAFYFYPGYFQKSYFSLPSFKIAWNIVLLLGFLSMLVRSVYAAWALKNDTKYMSSDFLRKRSLIQVVLLVSFHVSWTYLLIITAFGIAITLFNEFYFNL